MSRKHNKVGFIALAACSLLLTGCNESEIYPGLSDKVTITENDVFTQEDIVYIYEKLHDTSSTSSTIRDLILSKYADELVGKFSVNSNGAVVLEGYDGKTSDEQLEFVKEHKMYWDKEETSQGSNIYEPKEPTSLTATITNRVESVKEIVKLEVVKTIFNEANNSSYKTDNFFYEYKYARAKFESSKVGDFSEDLSKTDAKNIYSYQWEKDYTSLTSEEKATYPFSNKILIDSSISLENIESIIGTDNSTGVPILHLGLYSDYINREVIPNVMITLLVEQYIIDNQYTTLSRTQARNVSYVSISTDTTNINDARSLLREFIKTEIAPATKNDTINYKVLEDAWKGDVFDFSTNTVLPSKQKAADLLKNSGFKLVKKHEEIAELSDKTGTTYIDGKTEHYFYKNTEYGNLITDYSKINNDVNDTESNSQYSTFSSNSTQPVSVGLEKKINEIKTHDYTVTDWATKDNGLSSLPSSIKDNLYKYNVSVDTPTNPELFTRSDYVYEINGHYFLKKQNAQSEQLEDSILLRDGSTFYIVEINAAISQSKLAYNTTDYSISEKDKIARKIGYTMASGDTYKNTAFLSYLEKLDIKYNDQSLYDYMKETYPDLFD